MLKILLSLLLFASLVFSPALALSGFTEDKKLIIYESELTKLISITEQLKDKLLSCQTNYMKQKSELTALYTEMTNSEQTSMRLSETLSNSQASWNEYKKESQNKIMNLEGQRVLWIGAGAAGIIGGILIIIFNHK
jgi:hypothetical protein